jgi:glycosyltransferase involved in cell wall biosynthesis
MKIGINLLYLLPGVVGGTETYALSLLQALGQIDQQNEYIVFLNSESVGLELPVQANFEAVVCPVRARSRMARYLWEQSVLPLQARRHHLDLLHSLGYVQPLHLACPSVVTIHDLNFHNLGRWMPKMKRAVLRFFVTRSAQKADHILTVSEFSKSQLEEILGIPKDKITVTYNAVKKRSTDVLPFAELQQRYDIQKPYVLGLSSPSPHKNMAGLIKAFALVQGKGFSKSHLVLAGHPPTDKGSLDELIKRTKLRDSVFFTSYVPDEVLSSLYAHAELFVFPSLYEGFGIPLLEAFAHGTPVASSNAASLPEIGGDAVLYFDPRNIEEMAGVIVRLLQDEGLRNTLVAKGKERTKGFTWEKSARETLKVYNKIVEGDSL